MRFRTKDLMVTFSPNIAKELDTRCVFRTTICLNPTVTCHYPTVVPCAFHTTITACRQFTCGFVTHTACRFTDFPTNTPCNPTYTCPGSWWEIETIEDLVSIKEELRQTIAQLDELQQTGLPSQFASRAEAEKAEAALSQALEQVRAQKKNLK